jgi:site-specific recombinase XerD
MESKTKLLDQIRLVLRLKHMSIRTEDTYVHWVRRFILFYNERHPQEMGAPEIRAFLAHLTLHNQVASSTQNVALNALVFLYHYVLKQAFPDLEEIERAKRPGRIPAVLTREEVSSVLGHLTGIPHLMARCPFHYYTASLCGLASCPRKRESRRRGAWGLDACFRRHDVLLASDLRNGHL